MTFIWLKILKSVSEILIFLMNTFFSYNGKAVTHLSLRIALSQTKLIDHSKTVGTKQ